MNRTIYILSIIICFVSCTGHPDAGSKPKGQKNAMNAAEAPRPFHRIGNKMLIEYIEKFDRELGQDPEYANRGIAVYCHSYLTERRVDSLRYDITYNIIDYLPLPPFILCDSVNGKPVVVYFSDFNNKYQEFYMPADEAIETLKGTIPEKEYKEILDRLRESRKLGQELNQALGGKIEQNKDSKLEEDMLRIFISASNYQAYTLVFDENQNLLRFAKNWY